MIRNYLLTGLMALSAMSVSAQEIEMIPIEGGSFYMGNDYSFSNGVSIADEAPEHKVTVSSFKLSKTEVTFELYDLFCDATGKKKPDDGGYGRGKLPVVNVSWKDAIMFCNWMSARERLDKYYETKVDTSSFEVTGVNRSANGYRLPTEAEWEYAARGGANGKTYSYSGSNNFDEVAWCKRNASNKPHDVGTKKPNELGLYDMTGNAWEWCWDWYDKNYYKNSPETDPTGPDKGVEKVYRGGNWNSNIDYLRMTGRYHFQDSKAYGMIGIRLAQNN